MFDKNASPNDLRMYMKIFKMFNIVHQIYISLEIQ